MVAALRPTWQMTDAELIAEAEALNRAEDDAALADPATLMRHLVPTYKRRAHLRVVGAALADLADGRGGRLLITTPPQVGKTVTAVVGGAFWWLARHPAHRVIIGSYGSTLAIHRGRSVRKMVLEHGHRYGLALERGSQSVADWTLLSGGGCKSVGVGAGVVGSPGDIAIIDDPHKSRAEADSLRRRDAVYEWYSGDIISRLAPGAPVVLVMTRWHHDDLAARVLADEGLAADGGRWAVVHIPALSLGADVDPLHRLAGGPLGHPKVRAGDTAAALQHWEDKRRSSTLRDWFAQYQGDPRPMEGALLGLDLLKQRRCYQFGQGPCAPPAKAAVAVDPSGGGRDTAGIIGGYLGTDRRLYFTHDYSGVMSSDLWARRACELAAEINADRVIYEANYGGDMVLLAIRTAWDALRREELAALGGDESAPAYKRAARYNRLAPRITATTSRRNKLLRAEPIAQQWIEDRIRTAAHLPDLEQEWVTWQPDSTESPGRIDASVHMAWGLLPPPPAGTGHGGGPPPRGTLPASTLGPLG